MADTGIGPGWSEAQWDAVQSAVTEAFNKASIASQLLPCYGPLGASVEAVRREDLGPAVIEAGTPPTLAVTDDTTVKLFNLTVRVKISTQQAAEESLSAAILAFRRAANMLAQAEDEIVFRGYKSPTASKVMSAITEEYEALRKAKPGDPRYETAPVSALSGVITNQADPSPGLVDFHKPATKRKDGTTADPGGGLPPVTPAGSAEEMGQVIISQVAAAIATLEASAHPGPFGAVLGMDLFQAAYRPQKDSMILPADRITPLLNGPLLRSSMMPRDTGVVVSLSANSIDVLVATPPKVQFLQMTEEAKLVFRVYERFVLRNREPQQPGVTAFRIKTASTASETSTGTKPEPASPTRPETRR